MMVSRIFAAGIGGLLLIACNAVLLIACSPVAPSQSPAPGGSPSSGTPVAPAPTPVGSGAAESVAEALLCDSENDSSLSAMSGRLDDAGAIGDSDFWGAADVMVMNLDALNLGPDAVALRGTVRDSLRNLQLSDTNDAARVKIAGIAARALADLAPLICPPAEM